MCIGLVLPQIEMPDPADMAALAELAEACGLHHVLVYDHVVGIDRGRRPDFVGPYDVHDPFHEPLVFLGHLAGRVSLELWTGVLVLPQRQTVVVAKQAAQVDLLCSGNLRLGVGTGWNAAEYEALGEDFAARAVRYEEQVDLLRRLWTEEVVDFEGRFHRVRGAGLAPMPRQRPIPLWMGGGTGTAVLERIGRLADGWIAAFTRPGPELDRAMAVVRQSADRAGRPSDSVGLHAIIQPGADASSDRLRRQAQRWREAGAGYLSVSGMGAGRDPSGHMAFVEDVAQALVQG